VLRVRAESSLMPDTMRANVFHGVNDIRVEQVPRPHPAADEAVIRITLTTICGTDLHILRGEYPVRAGLVIGHEPVGVIDKLGDSVRGYKVGERVLVGAITPCGQCRGCLSGHLSQCGHGEGYEAVGGWRFGNTINGAQAEYLLVPSAQANLAKIPDGLSDEQVVLLSDIASTGFGGAESGDIRIGDAVVVFAQGPIGLCATPGAKLMGASLVIAGDGDGINDAPAMMAATVGMAIGQKSDVTAEAAGVVVMDNSLKKVDEFMHISRRMRVIALQSAVGGMALSIIGMIFAATGHLSPVSGAITQEVIDVLAVLNALRAALPPRVIHDL
jgi:alcohol dehydrogenase